MKEKFEKKKLDVIQRERKANYNLSTVCLPVNNAQSSERPCYKTKSKLREKKRKFIKI